MNRKFYAVYQYLAVLIILPLTVFLWYKELKSIELALTVIGLPVLTAYIIPFIGTNCTKFWEFNKLRFKIGKFRAYHGFVFGSATSLFGLMFYKISPEYSGIINSILCGLVCGAFLAFWNTLYDIYAVKCKFIKINNQAAYEGKSEYEAVIDYAPAYFYTLGFIYTLFLKFIQFSGLKYPFVIFIFYVSAHIIPILVYMCLHYIKYKTWGILRYKPKDKN